MAKIANDEQLVENVLKNQIVANRGEHKCEICEKICKTRRSLKNHFNSVHNNVGKTYKCNICSKTYQTEGKLKLHNKTYHKGQKDFKSE